MNGKQTLQKKLAHIQRQAQRRPAPSSPTFDGATVDVGDWTIATDADGSLIIHNVFTGNRIILARP